MPAITVFSYPRRTYISATIALAVMLVSGILVLTAWAEGMYNTYDIAAAGAQEALTGRFFGSPLQTPASAKISPMQEVHIANNGLILLRGARVVAVSDSVLHVAMSWSGSDYIWIVNTDSGTKFYSSAGTSARREDMRVGDVLSVSGMLLGNGQGTGLHAEYVRK